MLQNLSHKFYQWAKGWLVLVLLALDIFFAGFLMPLVGGLMQGGQGDIQPLDLMFFATPDQTFDMIEKYGDAGRVFYRNVELTVDIVYPIVYLFAFGLLISWLFKRGFSPDSKMMKLNVMPLGAWFFDLLENLNIVTLLAMHPAKPAFMAWLLMILTTAKWLFAFASIALILIGLVMAVRNRFRKQI